MHAFVRMHVHVHTSSANTTDRPPGVKAPCVPRVCTRVRLRACARACARACTCACIRLSVHPSVHPPARASAHPPVRAQVSECVRSHERVGASVHTYWRAHGFLERRTERTPTRALGAALLRHISYGARRRSGMACETVWQHRHTCHEHKHMFAHACTRA